MDTPHSTPIPGHQISCANPPPDCNKYPNMHVWLVDSKSTSEWVLVRWTTGCMPISQPASTDGVSLGAQTQVMLFHLSGGGVGGGWARGGFWVQALRRYDSCHVPCSARPAAALMVAEAGAELCRPPTDWTQSFSGTSRNKAREAQGQRESKVQVD